MKSQTKRDCGGLGGLAMWLLTAALFALRAIGVIAWPWVWVFAPLLITGGVIILVALISAFAIYKGFTGE